MITLLNKHRIFRLRKAMFLALIVLVLPQSGWTQVDGECGTDEVNAMYGPYKLPKPSKLASDKKEVLYTIPVVFHVIYHDSSQYISPRLVKEALDQLNMDFNLRSPLYNATQEEFKSIIGDGKIQFCLAAVDPEGQPTEGITYKETTQTEFFFPQQSNQMKDTLLGTASWDPLHYLNIWIVELTNTNQGTNTLGFAQFPNPNGIGNANDGAVLNNSIFGSPPYSTLSHEVGHYLGLRHPYTDTCGTDDGIADTPNSDTRNGGCTPAINCGSSDNVDNIMDGGVNCRMMFTQGQVAVMQGTLDSLRAALTLDSIPCIGGYCEGAFAQTGNEITHIEAVQLEAIDNFQSSIEPSAYSDFTDQKTDLFTDVPYSLSVKTEFNTDLFQNTTVVAWIDYNGDGNFLGIDEELGITTVDDPDVPATISFSIPNGALLGEARMRVRSISLFNNNTPFSGFFPCSIYPWGETEDYTVDLKTIPTAIDEDVNLPLSVIIYPNPLQTGQQLSAQLNVAKPGMVSIEMQDLTGRTVISTNMEVTSAGSQILQLPIQNLPAGSYIGNISMDESPYGYFKLIIFRQ